MKDQLGAQATTGGFQSFENVATDAVLAISYNLSGTRYAVASADHKVRIYDSGKQYDNGQVTLMDQWRAHDAEILDVSISLNVLSLIRKVQLHSLSMATFVSNRPISH